MIQDHVKRIRSVTNNPDVRLELGDVINEMKTFAILKDIPMITVSHLNRDGARVIDSQTSRTKSDLTRLLGKSNIGESFLMLDNVDYGAIINREYDADNNQYMIFKCIKKRVATMRDYICQPFMQDNDLRLVEDFYSSVPVFKESLYDVSMRQLSQNNTNTTTNIRTGGYANIAKYDNDDQNIYEFTESTSYSSLEEEIKLPNIREFVPLMERIS